MSPSLRHTDRSLDYVRRSHPSLWRLRCRRITVASQRSRCQLTTVRLTAGDRARTFRATLEDMVASPGILIHQPVRQRLKSTAQTDDTFKPLRVDGDAR